MDKFYIYVDESGQDTQGRIFIVALVISSSEQREEGERRLLEIETSSKKRLKKWKKTHYSLKEDYLRAVANIETLKGNIFYSLHANTRDYIRLTSDAIAKAFTQRARGPYTATVEIDGLSSTSAQKVAKHLKAEGIHYRKVRGVRDESSAWIRLADAIAGFVRDVQENKPYTRTLYSYLTQQGLLSEIKNAGVSGSSDPT